MDLLCEEQLLVVLETDVPDAKYVSLCLENACRGIMTTIHNNDN